MIPRDPTPAAGWTDDAGLMHRLFHDAPVGMAVVDLQGRFLLVNRAFCTITAHPEVELLAGDLLAITPAEYHEQHRRIMVGLVSGAEPVISFEKEFRRGAGGRVWVSIWAMLLRDPAGAPHAILSQIQDIQARKVAEDRLQLIEGVFAHASEAMMITDAGNRIVQVNEAFTRITGYAPAEVVGEDPRVLNSGRHGADFFQDMYARLQHEGAWEGEIWDRRKDGEIYPKWLRISVVRQPDGVVRHHLATFHDLSERKLAEQRLAFLDHHDSLTGLPHRAELAARLSDALGHASLHHGQAALLLLDLDRFKLVNDSIGHRVGDALITEVASRLIEVVGERGTLARLGGDEFAILIPQDASLAEIASLAVRCQEAIAIPCEVEGHVLHTTASIGISMYPLDGLDGVTLMRNAEAAMYHAKRLGGSQHQFYAQDMNRSAAEHLALENELRQALGKGEFEVHYQPQLDLRSGSVVGMEALIRWRRPDRGLISPAVFIPLAEETGMIVGIGAWVLRQACEDALAWHRAGHHLRIAVNLSVRQFHAQDLPRLVADTLAATGLEPRYLELEITEGAVMRQPEEAVRTLEALKQMGVQLAVDDFGTGYSSLGYLKTFPLDRLKIDRSFVQGMEDDADSRAITTATVALAHSLGLAVTAEGIETPAQQRLLRDLGCEEAQGFLFSRPLGPEHLAPYLATLPRS